MRLSRRARHTMAMAPSTAVTAPTKSSGDGSSQITTATFTTKKSASHIAGTVSRGG